MTTNNNTLTFTLGETVYNSQSEKFGTIIEKDGKMRVSINHTENGKSINLTAPLSEKWAKVETGEKDAQNVPDASKTDTSETGETSKDILSDILANPKSKTGETDKPKTETKDAAYVPMTDDEKSELKKLEKEYRKFDSLEQKIPFEKARVLNEIRNKKLFRDTHATFYAYAVEVLGLHEKYAQNLAQIGAFAEVTSEFISDKNVSLSINSANRLIRNQNKLADNLQMPDAELSEFSPVLKQVIGITIETAKDANNNSNLTPKICDAVSDEVSESLTEFFDYSGTDIIERAAAKLAENRAKIVSNSKVRLTTKKDAETSETCEHTQVIKSLENNLITLVCGCTFRYVKA